MSEQDLRVFTPFGPLPRKKLLKFEMPGLTRGFRGCECFENVLFFQFPKLTHYEGEGDLTITGLLSETNPSRVLLKGTETLEPAKKGSRRLTFTSIISSDLKFLGARFSNAHPILQIRQNGWDFRKEITGHLLQVT